jgi:ion channel-forming bestrophin family protein
LHIKESTTQSGTNPIAAPTGVFEGLGKAIFATAVFRCWHFILFFTIEATIVTYVHQTGIRKLSIQSVLMNVLGTVLGQKAIIYCISGA